MELETQPVLELGLLFLAFYVVVVLLVSWRSIIERARRLLKRSHLEHRVYKRATIAHDLIPKLSPFLSKKPTFYITAADGHPLTGPKWYPWSGFIRRALVQGCTIHYILADASPADQQKLIRLRHQLQAGTEGILLLYFVAPDRVESGDRELVETLQTFHLVLAEAGDERLMWIEGYHPLKTTLAYSCEFVPPSEASKDRRYSIYREALEGLTQKYSAPLADSQAA